jgi:hypothetical protein
MKDTYKVIVGSEIKEQMTIEEIKELYFRINKGNFNINKTLIATIKDDINTVCIFKTVEEIDREEKGKESKILYPFMEELYTPAIANTMDNVINISPILQVIQMAIFGGARVNYVPWIEKSTGDYMVKISVECKCAECHSNKVKKSTTIFRNFKKESFEKININNESVYRE